MSNFSKRFRASRVKNVFIFCLILNIFSSPFISEAKDRVSCKAVIFSDSTRGQRLYSKRVDARILPASTAKVMTALIVLKKLPLGKYIRVSPRALYPQPSKIDVKAGEQYKVKDLLYAILLSSANDASIVLAEAVAGSEGEFVRLMNKRAKQLGAKHTNFANSNGLPSRSPQYSTAYDMYLIFRQALKHYEFREAIQARYKIIRSRGGRQITLKSHNKILFLSNWKKKVYGKTGYTRAAQSCFIGTLKKGKSDLIIATFGCTDRWDDIRHIVSRYGKVNVTTP